MFSIGQGKASGRQVRSAPSALLNGILAVGVCASLAAGALGVARPAEARIEGDPLTGYAQVCKNIQDAYDNAIGAYYEAETPDSLIEARQRVNYWTQQWHDHGCDQYYGSIVAMVDPGSTTAVGPTTVGVNQGPADGDSSSVQVHPVKASGSLH